MCVHWQEPVGRAADEHMYAQQVAYMMRSCICMLLSDIIHAVWLQNTHQGGHAQPGGSLEQNPPVLGCAAGATGGCATRSKRIIPSQHMVRHATAATPISCIATMQS